MHSFRSRISVFLLFIILISVAPLFFIPTDTKDPGELYLAYGIVAGSILLVVAMLFSMRYRINETELVINMGPITYFRIKLNEITKVERSYNPLSSPDRKSVV